MSAFLVLLYSVAMFLCVILIICWIILPFALIGTKPLLAKLLEQQHRTNTLLERIAAQAERDGPH